MRSVSAERGTVVVFLAIFLSVLFGIAALVVDHGHNLSEHRRLTTATDSAALAAAAAYGAGADGCQVAAPEYLARNSVAAVLTSCIATGDTAAGTFGWVVVTAEQRVEQYFAKTLGHDETTVSSQSVAVFGMPTMSYSGARPMGLCLEGLTANSDYQDWEAGPPENESAPIRVKYNKDQNDLCGDTTGNWGFIDFDGGSNSNNDAKEWIENGFPGALSLGTYSGDPGAMSGSHKSALQSLVDSELVFWMPLFDTASGNGSNVLYTVSEFLPARLVGFKSTGKGSKRYLEFVIVPNALAPELTCCAPSTGPDTGVRKIGLYLLDDAGQPIGLTS